MATTTSDSTRGLVSKAYNPRVAVIASPEAQALCVKNNLTVSQLISPFCNLTTTLYWHEPNGTQIIPRNFRITPVDIASWKPPRPDTQRNKQVLQSRVAKLLPNFTYDSHDSEEQSNGVSQRPYLLYKLGKPGLTKEYRVEVPSGTPWFEAWRNLFLRFQSEQQSSQHEFMSHFLGCIMVISSSEGKNADELGVIIGKLSKLQQQHQTEWPNSWFLPSILKFYLILHDNSSDDSKSAEALYQSLRTTYTGNACCLLKINSGAAELEQSRKLLVPDPWKSIFDQEQIQSNERSSVSGVNNFTVHDVLIDPVNTSNLPHPLSPEAEFPPLLENGIVTTKDLGNVDDRRGADYVPRGQCMTPEDVQNIQVAVNEFIAKALLPYVERQTRVLHDSIVNRRSMSKSFFSATKRLFGTTSKSITHVVYNVDSLEIASRKLADLYFLFGNYSGAYQLYHQLKKDFQGDQAWIYYASALEMAALSHFMMAQLDSPLLGARSFPVHYVSEAIKVYTENCRMPDFAIRCSILCCECLMELENYGEAAAVLIRMTSEDCDLRSALMLEQAAYAFLKLNSPRKYALHSVLAGHRYAKAGLRSHSLNSYLQAAQIYYGRGWRFAEDHIYVTITKHQSILLQTQNRLAEHLKSLLRAPPPQLLPLPPPPVTSEGKSPVPVPKNENPPKVTASAPLQPSLRLEYSFLKAFDSLTHIGLLKIHNLTPVQEVVFTGFEFNQPKFRVDKLIPDVESCDEKSPILQLGPSETRNIALRVKEVPVLENAERQATNHQHPHLFLHVKWFFYPSESARQSQSPVTGTYQLRIRKSDMIPRHEESLANSEFPIVFQLLHKPRVWNDFGMTPFCVCPIELTVSCRWSGRLAIEISKRRQERHETTEKHRAGSAASSEGVYFVGQTRWVLDIEALESIKLTCYAGVSHPGVYNVGPLLHVTSYSKSVVAESGFAFESEKEYPLHSPLIVAQARLDFLQDGEGDNGSHAYALDGTANETFTTVMKHEKLEISPPIC